VSAARRARSPQALRSSRAEGFSGLGLSSDDPAAGRCRCPVCLVLARVCMLRRCGAACEARARWAQAIYGSGAAAPGADAAADGAADAGPKKDGGDNVVDAEFSDTDK